MSKRLNFVTKKNQSQVNNEDSFPKKTHAKFFLLNLAPPERLVLDGRVVRHDHGRHPEAGGRHQEGARGEDQ